MRYVIVVAESHMPRINEIVAALPAASFQWGVVTDPVKFKQQIKGVKMIITNGNNINQFQL